MVLNGYSSSVSIIVGVYVEKKSHCRCDYLMSLDKNVFQNAFNLIWVREPVKSRKCTHKVVCRYNLASCFCFFFFVPESIAARSSFLTTLQNVAYHWIPLVFSGKVITRYIRHKQLPIDLFLVDLHFCAEIAPF